MTVKSVSREAGKADGERAGIFLTHMQVCERTLQPNTHIPAFGCHTETEVGEGRIVSLYFQFSQHYGGNLLFIHYVKRRRNVLCVGKMTPFPPTFPGNFITQVKKNQCGYLESF